MRRSKARPADLPMEQRRLSVELSLCGPTGPRRGFSHGSRALLGRGCAGRGGLVLAANVLVELAHRLVRRRVALHPGQLLCARAGQVHRLALGCSLRQVLPDVRRDDPTSSFRWRQLARQPHLVGRLQVRRSDHAGRLDAQLLHRLLLGRGRAERVLAVQRVHHRRGQVRAAGEALGVVGRRVGLAQPGLRLGDTFLEAGGHQLLQGLAVLGAQVRHLHLREGLGRRRTTFSRSAFDDRATALVGELVVHRARVAALLLGRDRAVSLAARGSRLCVADARAVRGVAVGVRTVDLLDGQVLHADALAALRGGRAGRPAVHDHRVDLGARVRLEEVAVLVAGHLLLVHVASRVDGPVLAARVLGAHLLRTPIPRVGLRRQRQRVRDLVAAEVLRPAVRTVDPRKTFDQPAVDQRRDAGHQVLQVLLVLVRVREALAGVLKVNALGAEARVAGELHQLARRDVQVARLAGLAVGQRRTKDQHVGWRDDLAVLVLGLVRLGRLLAGLGHRQHAVGGQQLRVFSRRPFGHHHAVGLEVFLGVFPRVAADARRGARGLSAFRLVDAVEQHVVHRPHR